MAESAYGEESEYSAMHLCVCRLKSDKNLNIWDARCVTVAAGCGGIIPVVLIAVAIVVMFIMEYAMPEETNHPRVTKSRYQP